MNLTGLIITMASHIVAPLYMAKRKYNKLITIGLWILYVCAFMGIMRVQNSVVVGFFGTLIAHLVIFFITTQGTMGEKLFLFLTYSNSFCVCLGANLYASVFCKSAYALNIINVAIFLLMHIFLYKILIPKHKKSKAFFENGWSKLNIILLLFLMQFANQYAFNVDADTAGLTIFNFIAFSLILYLTLMVFYILVEDNAEKNKRITENRKLINIAYIDALTKLKNRTAYKEFIKKSQEQHTENEDDVFLVSVMDIDDFKNINDTYGHIKGDKVLREVAEILEEYFQGDQCELFRIGGDEFVLISKAMNAVDLEEHMRIINEKTTEGPDITLSFGCAIVDFNNLNPFDVAFDKADKMMYLNKKEKALVE